MADVYNVVSGKDVLDEVERRAERGRPYLRIRDNYIPLIYVEGRLPGITEEAGINYRVQSGGHSIIIPSDIALPENSKVLETIRDSVRISNHYIPTSMVSKKGGENTTTDYASLLHLYFKQEYNGKEERGIVVLGGHTGKIGETNIFSVKKYMGVFEDDAVILTPFGLLRLDRKYYLPDFYNSLPRNFKGETAQKNSAFQDLDDAIKNGELEDIIKRTIASHKKGMNPLF